MFDDFTLDHIDVGGGHGGNGPAEENPEALTTGSRAPLRR